MSIGIIVRLTIREAARRKVVLGLLVLGIVFLMLYTLGWVFVKSQMRIPKSAPFSLRDGYNFLLIAGLYAANFLIVMLSVLVSVDTVAGEISSGTIQSIAVKPLPRRDILLGKWLGFVIMLGVCVLTLAGGVILITAIVSGGYFAPNSLGGLALMYLESLVLLSISLLGGTRLSTLANGVLGFGLFGLALIGGWIEQAGSFLNSTAAISIGQITALIMPSEALWRLVQSNMSEGLNPFKLMFSLSSEPDQGMVIYAIVFAVALLLLAMRSFQRRDL
jgi:Cu-processing system permease protein